MLRNVKIFYIREEHMIYNIEHLKTKEEYQKELQDLHEELGVGIATDTLIKDDLKMLTRIDEIMIILDFMERNGGKYK